MPPRSTLARGVRLIRAEAGIKFRVSVRVRVRVRVAARLARVRVRVRVRVRIRLRVRFRVKAKVGARDVPPLRAARLAVARSPTRG